MKIKSVFLAPIIAAIVLLLFVPLPSVGVKILYILDVAYGMVIIGFGIYATVKKQIPKIFPQLILFFTICTLVIDVASTRYLFMYKIQIEDIPLVSKMVDDIFISSPIAGYLLFAVGVFLTCYSIVRLKHIHEVVLNGSINFLRGTMKIIFLLIIVSIIGCWAIGFSKLELNYIESFTFYIPYICTQFLIYFIPLIMAGIGIDMLNWGRKIEKEV